MGVLSDGTPYLNQRGLAALCGVENAHIGTISTQWSDVDQKPRILRIKAILQSAGVGIPDSPHIEIPLGGHTHHCFPQDICLAILEYYAFDAGINCQPEAKESFRRLAGSKFREFVYSQVGYDVSIKDDKFKKWHDRIALNFQSAPRGYFHVFNEAHTIIYEMIRAGANIGEKFVVDISIGQHWSKYWIDNGLDLQFGLRKTYSHNYPLDHPQAQSNPQESWCYPWSALGAFRAWLQDVYIEGGKFSGYLKRKVACGELKPEAAQLASAALVPTRLPPPA